MRLVLTEGVVGDLKALLASNREKGTILYASRAHQANGSVRLLVSHFESLDEEAVTSEANHLTMSAVSVGTATEVANRSSRSLVFVHTHVGDAVPDFSPSDDHGEHQLASFLAARGTSGPHVSLLVTARGLLARELGTRSPIEIVIVGERLSIVTNLNGSSEKHARQERILGPGGQAVLQGLHVGIVGLGGLGSIVLEELARLGVQRFTLVDPDRLDPSNLNRVVGTSPKDVGQPKVEIARRAVATIEPAAKVNTIADSVLERRVSRRIADTDLFFCCTDNHASRSIMSVVAYQYLVPCIDVGIVISTSNHRITGISGRVQLLSPGVPCLVCMALLDPVQIRLELSSPEHRKADPYFHGPADPQPAVIPFNGVLSSLAVAMFLTTATGTPGNSRFLLYDGISGAVRPVAAARDPNCVVCSSRGALGKGDLWPPPGR